MTLVDTTGGVSVRAEQRRIGYVFQDARLFPHMNVLVTCNTGRSARKALNSASDSTRSCALLGLACVTRTPSQSAALAARSSAWRWARALLAQPRLLLLDEPLASLDAARREEVLPYLEALARSGSRFQ